MLGLGSRSTESESADVFSCRGQGKRDEKIWLLAALSMASVLSLSVLCLVDKIHYEIVHYWTSSFIAMVILAFTVETQARRLKIPILLILFTLFIATSMQFRPYTSSLFPQHSRILFGFHFQSLDLYSGIVFSVTFFAASFSLRRLHYRSMYICVLLVVHFICGPAAGYCVGDIRLVDRIPITFERAPRLLEISPDGSLILYSNNLPTPSTTVWRSASGVERIAHPIQAEIVGARAHDGHGLLLSQDASHNESAELALWRTSNETLVNVYAQALSQSYNFETSRNYLSPCGTFAAFPSDAIMDISSGDVFDISVEGAGKVMARFLHWIPTTAWAVYAINKSPTILLANPESREVVRHSFSEAAVKSVSFHRSLNRAAYISEGNDKICWIKFSDGQIGCVGSSSGRARSSRW